MRKKKKRDRKDMCKSGKEDKRIEALGIWREKIR
jgi:hypothetical protein